MLGLVRHHGVVAVGSCGQARRTGLPHAGEIFTLYVAPEFQELGIGRALLRRLFDALIDRGLDSALTWVLAQNPGRNSSSTIKRSPASAQIRYSRSQKARATWN